MATKYLFLSLLVVLFLGCHNHTPNTANNEHDHEHETENESEHAHEHGDVKLQLTAYSNDFEVFAEADPFSVGNSSGILAHFSYLKNFKALESGSITARLQVGAKSVEQTLEQPTRKGIFSFDIKPETEGTGQLVFSIKTDSASYELVVPDIHVFGDAHDAIHGAEDEVTPKTNTIGFTKEQSWKIDFATELPQVIPFGQVIKTTAIVNSAPEDGETVSAKTSGIVKFTGAAILAGRSVSAGQSLFLISGDEMADNNSKIRFSEAKNNFEKARTDYDRMSLLAKDKIVSDKDLLEARNKLENAEAIYTNLNTNFSSKGQSVKSTISGFVKQLLVTNGQYVEAGQPLVELTKNKTLLLQADVQQKYASLLSTVQSAIVRIPHENRTYTLEELNGKVLSFGRSANSSNYLIPVSLQINNTGNFTAGSFVEIFLKTLSNTQALTVPNTALMEEQGNYFVFVQVNPELFEKREVVLGPTDGMRTEIKSGIGNTDRVVSKGAILVKLAQSSGALDAHSGHVH